MSADNRDLVVDPAAAEYWIDRWDSQQEGFIPDREERFAVLGDAVAAALDGTDAPVLVDLGCGPGSLTARLAQRLPGAVFIGVDADPLLLALARSRYGDTATWIQADLADPEWITVLPGTIHAAVSSTALHWMDRGSLAALYTALAARTAPGGVFANADHMPLPDRLTALSAAVHSGRTRRAGVAGREGWAAWWEAALSDPRLSPASAGRPRPSADASAHHHGTNALTAADHTRLLHTAGYASAAPLWQTADDHIITAIR